MAFLYPFIVFLQPGILWPELAPYRPFLALSLVAALLGAMHKGAAAMLVERLRHPIFLWLCGYVFIQAISVYYSGVMAILDMFSFWDTYAIFVAVSLLLLRDNQQLSRFIAGMLVGCSVVIGYGLYAVFTHAPQLEGNRAGSYGMYQNHNDYSFIILMSLPYAYSGVRVAKRFLVKLVLIIYVAACILGIALSLSRGGIIGLVLMLALLYWRSTTGARRTVGMVVLLALGSGGIVVQFAAREENQRGHYTAEDAKTSRYELWRAARKIIEKHPILGIGSGRFSEKARDYAELSHNNIGKVSHNTYLEVLTGSGIAGFICFMAMLLGVLRASTEKLGAHRSGVPPPLRTATQVCIFTIMLRALLDAKTYDWSFYLLAVLGILIASTTGAEAPAEAGPDPAPESQALAVRRRAPYAPPAARPAVYGRRA